jgi:tRNA/tmRNA/rRNA uracil-C5-methylase (TrmA/RlmC/RlmD family)
MFSTGNVTEKARMARMPAAGQTIVDLFVGIGYFTIPLLVPVIVGGVRVVKRVMARLCSGEGGCCVCTRSGS